MSETRFETERGKAVVVLFNAALYSLYEGDIDLLCTDIELLRLEIMTSPPPKPVENPCLMCTQHERVNLLLVKIIDALRPGKKEPL